MLWKAHIEEGEMHHTDQWLSFFPPQTVCVDCLRYMLVFSTTSLLKHAHIAACKYLGAKAYFIRSYWLWVEFSYHNFEELCRFIVSLSVVWKLVRDHEKLISFQGNDSCRESAKSDGMHVVFFSNNDLSGSGLSLHYDNSRLEIAAQDEKEHEDTTK